jgi:protein CpxP
MSLLRTLPSLAAACGLTLFAFASASAQDATPAPPAAPAQHGGMMHEHMEHRAHMRAEHLRLLHDALGIRSDQEGAWQAFAAAMAPQPGAEDERRAWHDQHAEGMEGARHLTTPERLDRMQARMTEHMAAFQRHAAAVKALYAALTPAQQRTFDALARLHSMHGMHGGGFRHEGLEGHGEMGGMGGMDKPIGG